MQAYVPIGMPFTDVPPVLPFLTSAAAASYWLFVNTPPMISKSASALFPPFIGSDSAFQDTSAPAVSFEPNVVGDVPLAYPIRLA